MQTIQKKHRKVVYALIGLLLITACQSRGQTEDEDGAEGEKNGADEKFAQMSSGVELDRIQIKNKSIQILQDQAEYGGDLVDLDLLQNFLVRMEQKTAGEDMFTLEINGHKVDVEAASKVYYLDGIAYEAQGPSFIYEKKNYLHVSILEALTEDLRSIEGGIELYRPFPSTDKERELEPVVSHESTLGHMTLVNKDYPIDKEATGKDLVNLNQTYPGYAYTKNDMQLEKKAAQQMVYMLDDMSSLEKTYVVSTYRSYDYQEGLLKRKIEQYKNQYGYDDIEARKEAVRIVAIPGSSEHQTGLAIDFSSETLVRENKYLESEFLETEAGKWLQENAHRYGFVLRYLEDAEPITQIRPEAWHYRYVDQPHSSLMYENNMVLETYIAHLKENRVLEAELDERSLVIYLEPTLASKVYVDPATVDVSNSNEGGFILTVW